MEYFGRLQVVSANKAFFEHLEECGAFDKKLRHTWENNEKRGISTYTWGRPVAEILTAFEAFSGAAHDYISNTPTSMQGLYLGHIYIREEFTCENSLAYEKANDVEGFANIVPTHIYLKGLGSIEHTTEYEDGRGGGFLWRAFALRLIPQLIEHQKKSVPPFLQSPQEIKKVFEYFKQFYG